MENGQSGTLRWLDIGPDRIESWLDGFAGRHGGATTDSGPQIVTVRAADGAVAECHPPFPPLPPGTAGTGAELALHAGADRTVGVLLVRLGGYAAGVFAGGDARLVASKVGSRLVHGRSAAGGTSQHRFARRREKQASEALAAAADCAVRVFGAFGVSGPSSGVVTDVRPSRHDERLTGPRSLDAVVLGGDKRAMAALREDVRLRPYFALAVERFLTVPDPRLTVLQATPRAFRAIRIRLTEN